MTKICNKCKKLLLISNFSKDKRKTDGLMSLCRNCYSKRNKEYYNAHKSEYSVRAKRWRDSHQELLRERRKRDIKKRRIWFNTWVKNHPKRWRELIKRRTEKERNSPELKLKKSLRNRLRIALLGKNKSDRTLNLLSMPITDFKKYLESKFLPGMSWDNYGRWKRGTPMKWHVDHIKPCDVFDLTKPEEQRACFHWSNMQPMWANENCTKKAKIDYKPASR
jgi:hypothetical protein